VNRVEEFEERVSIMVESGIPERKALMLASRDNSKRWAWYLEFLKDPKWPGWSRRKIERFEDRVPR
jgi:hypothetical protein